MKRFTVGLTAVVLGLAFLISPSTLDARGGFGGHGGWGGHHGGFHGGHGGFHGSHSSFFFGFGAGFWPGYYWNHYPFYWAPPVVGWPYYPPAVTEAPPLYSEPDQQQPYYWYYCQDPKGYYPYIKNCPGGWIPVVPNVTPPDR